MYIKLITIIICVCSVFSVFGQDTLTRKQNKTQTTQTKTSKKKSQPEKKKASKNTTGSGTPAKSGSVSQTVLKVRGSVNPSSVSLNSSGESNFFISVSGVSGSYDYSISTPSWITYYDKTSSGFRIKCSSNSDSSSRSGYITVNGNGQQVMLYVTQSSNYTSLKVNGSEQYAHTFPSYGGVKTFTVSGGIPDNYNVTVPYWLYYRKEGQKLTITCYENPSESQRSAWIDIDDGRSSARVAIVQNASINTKNQSSTGRNSTYQQSYDYTNNKSYRDRTYRYSSWAQHDNSFYIFAQGGVGLVEGEIAPAAGGGFGFNLRWFNMEWDYLGVFAPAGSWVTGSISLGYNIFSDRRFQLTPQAGLGFMIAHGEGSFGGSVALRWDIGLCHHLNLFIKPKVIIGSTVIPSLGTGLSVYF